MAFLVHYVRDSRRSTRLERSPQANYPPCDKMPRTTAGDDTICCLLCYDGSSFPGKIFWKAHRPRIHEDGDGWNCQIIRQKKKDQGSGNDDKDNVVQEGDADKDGEGYNKPEYIMHLRPGYKIFFPDETGSVIQSAIIKKCDACGKIKDDVESERCGKVVGSLECFHEKSVCRACTTRATCTHCGWSFCLDEVHRFGFVKCTAKGCKNIFCDSDCERFYNFDSDPTQLDTVCSYKHRRKHYCDAHKPEGVRPNIDSYLLEVRCRMMQRHGSGSEHED
eukprot:scaffold3075_cov134-Amphora_coffeaeformis.AAC.1